MRGRVRVEGIESKKRDLLGNVKERSRKFK